MTTADELDREQIDQLHSAVVQISANCFELKKLAATILVAAGTLISAFTNRALDSSLFISGLLVLLVFWAADAQSYYYQRKIRLKMTQLQERRIERAGLADYPAEGVGLPVRDAVRRRGVFASLFNPSMLYYALLAAVMVLAWIMFLMGAIG